MTSASWQIRQHSFVLLLPLTTEIWLTATNKSACVAVVGSSTIHQRTQEVSSLPVNWVIGRQTYWYKLWNQKEPANQPQPLLAEVREHWESAEFFVLFCFFKENLQVAKRYMKRYLISLIIWEVQIETTVRYHFMSVRMSSRRQEVTNIDTDVEKSKFLCTPSENLKWYSHSRKLLLF